MAAWRYGFNLLVLKTSLTHSQGRGEKGKLQNKSSKNTQITSQKRNSKSRCISSKSRGPNFHKVSESVSPATGLALAAVLDYAFGALKALNQCKM